MALIFSYPMKLPAKNGLLILPFCIFHLLINSLFGQALSDFVILRGQDTLLGEVRFNLANPASLKFAPSSSGKTKSYGVNDILSFTHADIPYFPKALDENGPMEFMKLVVKGYANLWQRSSGYYLEKEGQMIELERSGVKETSQGSGKKFQGILKFNLSDCESIPWSAYDRLTYSQKNLSNLISRYNNCVAPEEKKAVYLDKKRFPIIYGVEGGLTSTTVSWLKDETSFTVLEEEGSSGILLGAFVEIPFHKHFSGLVQVQYKNAETVVIRDGSVRQHRNQYEFSFIDFPISLKWKGIDLGKGAIFLQAGFIVGTPLTKSNINQRGYPTWQENTIEEEDFLLSQTDLATSRQGYQLGGGYEFYWGPRNSLRLSYIFENSRYEDYRFNIQGVKLGIGF